MLFHKSGGSLADLVFWSLDKTAKCHHQPRFGGKPNPYLIACSGWRSDPARHSSSSSRWQNRQSKDQYVREARVQGLKSRAAFKLLEINQKHKIFQRGQTVVDLGYAPGSWSQVARERTWPSGRIVGIDIIPAPPPKGVSTIQGNFLSQAVRDEVKNFLREPDRGRPRRQISLAAEGTGEPTTEEELDSSDRGYLEMERRADLPLLGQGTIEIGTEQMSQREIDETEGRMVDVVLSDMCEPWEQTSGFWKRSLSNPYFRMMNTSGLSFRDHADSMDLCYAALSFGFDTIRTGGHFVCKYYQGKEDTVLEKKLRILFRKVHRLKPFSSRQGSKEGYFIALRRRADVQKQDVLRDTS